MGFLAMLVADKSDEKCVDFVDKPGIRVVPRPRYVSLAFGKYSRVVFVVKIQTKTFYLRFTQSNA